MMRSRSTNFKNHNIGMHILAATLVAFTVGASAKDDVPEVAASVVGLGLDAAQAKLQKSGYEIAESSLYGGKQLWWNESENSCVELKFDKDGEKAITAVSPGDKGDCKKGAAASRKVWDSYKDGQAPASFAALDAERSKLSDSGLEPVYWTQDMAPGKDAETWFDEDSQTCKRIIWSSKDNSNVKTINCKPEQGSKPGPK